MARPYFLIWRAAAAGAAARGAKPPYTFRSRGRDTWPAALPDLRCEFEAGRVPKDTRSALAEAKCWGMRPMKNPPLSPVDS